MLTRVLEPEVMDSSEEAIDYDAMDHSEVNRKFVDDLLAFAGNRLLALPDAEEMGTPLVEVLDMGTGTAQIPIELCRRGEGFRIVACDLSTSMLEVAIMKIDIAGLRWRVFLSHADAKRLPYESERFEVVMSNSIVHHIPEPKLALQEGVRVLKPGGAIFVRDLLRPEDNATVGHLVDTYAAGCNDHQRAMFRRFPAGLAELGGNPCDRRGVRLPTGNSATHKRPALDLGGAGK